LGIAISFFIVTFIMAYSLVRLGFKIFTNEDAMKRKQRLLRGEKSWLDHFEDPEPDPSNENGENIAIRGLHTFAETFWNLYALFMQQSKDLNRQYDRYICAIKS